VTLKLLATGVAALATNGATAAGVTSLAAVNASAQRVQPVVLGAPGAASADVTASGPQLAPTTQNLTFVNQGGWKLSRSSAMSLLQSVQS
jgi:hypothetical protein